MGTVAFSLEEKARMAKTIKFPEADNRLFKRVFICRDCGAKNRTDLIRVKTGRVKCRKCRGAALRLKHREIKA